MPLSIFLGRPWPAPGEPLWLDSDQDAAVAWRRFSAVQQAETCHRCGTRPDDWIDPVTRRRWGQPPYRAEIHVCAGCETVADAEEELRDGGSGGAGARVVLVANRDDELEW